MGRTGEIALTQMKKTVQKLGGSIEGYGDPTLLRFLNARSMREDKAAKMFVQWQKWRASFVPKGFIPDSQISDELAARKAYLQGLSKDGYPVLIFKGARHFPCKDHVQCKIKGMLGHLKPLKKQQIHPVPVTLAALTAGIQSSGIHDGFVVYMMDKAIASAIKEREIGNEKIIVLVDLRQLTYKNFDPRGLINAVELMQAYYPERLAKLYMFYMPRFFVSVWKMVCRYLDKGIRDKVQIARKEADRKRFIAEIGAEVLPKEFGGRAQPVAIQDAIVPPLRG